MAGSYGQLDASAKSLLCLLKGLETYRTTIELRNEIVIKGKINHVDEKMNTTITEATYKLLDGTSRQFDELFIQGAQIRYVHIPQGVDVMNVIKRKVDEVCRRSDNHSKQRVTAKKRKQIDEEKRIVREYVIGKGRSDNDRNDNTNDQKDK